MAGGLIWIWQAVQSAVFGSGMSREQIQKLKIKRTMDACMWAVGSGQIR